MTLVLCATQSWGVIVDTAGNVRRNMPVSFDVPLYSDAEGTTPITAPITDAKGRVPGYVEAGLREVTYDGQTLEVQALSAADVADAAQGKARRAFDVIVLGGNETGIMAAVAAARHNLDVLLVSEDDRVGGMTAWGMTQTDFVTGRPPSAVGGLAREFFARVARAELQLPDFVQWYRNGGPGRPSWYQRGFSKLLSEHPNVTTLYNGTLDAVVKSGTTITSVTLSGKRYTAPVFVDATTTGDVVQKAGLSRSVGRESSATYGEAGAGVITPANLPNNPTIDPYVTPGDSNSGVIFGVDAGAVEAVGTGDGRVMGFGYRLFVTSVAGEKAPWPTAPPAGYSAAKYELIGRVLAASPTYYGDATAGLTRFLTLYDVGLKPGTTAQGGTPLTYADLNANGPVSTNYPNAAECLEYVTASPARRAEITANAKSWIMGLIYWVLHSGDSRIPANLIAGLNQYGPSTKELAAYGGISPELYVREGARVVGDYVMSQSDANYSNGFTDYVAWGSYDFDSHAVRRVIVGGQVKQEGATGAAATAAQFGFPVPIRVLFPKVAECTNLVCPGAPSVSRIVHTVVRAKPVLMVLGEAAGHAAAIAKRDAVAVQNVSVQRVQRHQDLTRVQNAIVLSAGDGVYLAGSWSESGAGSAFVTISGAKRLGNAAGAKVSPAGNVRKAKYVPAIYRSGQYKVLVKYPPTDSSEVAGVKRASNVAVTIAHADGTTTRVVNQLWPGGDGGDWDELGVFYFSKAGGTFGTATQYVEINSDGATADGAVVVDAVKWQPVAP